MSPLPAANRRFMGNSGDVPRYKGRGWPSTRVAKDSIWGSLTAAALKTGVSTSSTPRAAKYSRASASMRARVRKAASAAVGRQSLPSDAPFMKPSIRFANPMSFAGRGTCRAGDAHEASSCERNGRGGAWPARATTFPRGPARRDLMARRRNLGRCEKARRGEPGVHGGGTLSASAGHVTYGLAQLHHGAGAEHGMPARPTRLEQEDHGRAHVEAAEFVALSPG